MFVNVAIDPKNHAQFESQQNLKQKDGQQEKAKSCTTQKRNCAHPNGLKRQLQQADSIEDAMDVLLEASNDQRKVRARVRKAATLVDALESHLR